MIRVLGIGILALGLMLSAGCASDVDRQMATREITADADTTFASAVSVMRRDFDRLNIDRTARTITAEPQEFTTRSDSGTTRDLIRAPSKLRRVATLSVRPRGEDRAQVRLRIDRQREDTTRVEQSQPGQYRLSDAPGYTPIERDAATSTRQNSVWTNIGRDNVLEREMLGELERLFSKSTEPAAPASQPAPGQETP
ncbi:MAG: hypothetical protein HZB38_13120 [Planctomycetes bacterium]|nr:hypothetical protein [Planctomycetota bacterium]